jgi:hypothetical protein
VPSMARSFSSICRFAHIFGTFLRSIHAQFEFVFSTLLLMLKDLSEFVPYIFNIFLDCGSLLPLLVRRACSPPLRAEHDTVRHGQQALYRTVQGKLAGAKAAASRRTPERLLRACRKTLRQESPRPWPPGGLHEHTLRPTPSPGRAGMGRNFDKPG